MGNKISAIALSAAMFTVVISAGQTPMPYTTKFRPQFHFSPKEHWMNDPNGMVFFHGLYHLFFQYYPGDIVWGPMHWGHATSKDLVHWQEQPIALFPDSLGYVFSGSAVVDPDNTSGFGRDGKTPLVAIFTQHDPKGEKNGTVDFQNQGIAYSLDEGMTWTKYEHNPVIRNPGIRDFRDPKVNWYAPGKKWVMTLAVSDHVEFWSSPDLKAWKKESGFGIGAGSHGGVWECPDLFPMEIDGASYWVLLVSVNPGSPNGGSGTQYFIGHFDGKEFHPVDSRTRWIDYGPDDYAGVTWSNTGHRRIFLGWMSNWEYADRVPTTSWRSAMTVPRELRLQRSGETLYLASRPTTADPALPPGHTKTASAPAAGCYRLTYSTGPEKDFSILLSNRLGEKLIVGYEKDSNRYYIDRSASGQTNFSPQFAARAYSPRLSNSGKITIELLADASSVELFADDGLTVMTMVFFPTEPMNKISARSGRQPLQPLSNTPISSIWP